MAGSAGGRSSIEDIELRFGLAIGAAAASAGVAAGAVPAAPAAPPPATAAAAPAAPAPAMAAAAAVSAAAPATEARRLQLEHRAVAAAGRHQLVVRAELDHPAVLEHADAVGVTHRREAMGDEDRGGMTRRREDAV